MSQFHGFTFDTLGWRAWLDTVSLDEATPEQLAVLEESHPHAKTSDYYCCSCSRPKSCGNAPGSSTPSCMPQAACRAWSANWRAPWFRA